MMEEEDYVRDPSKIDYMVQKSLLAKNKLAIIIKSPEGNQYCCVQCPVQCLVKEELEVHLLTHNNEYRHLCSVCGTGLKRKEHMDRHMYEHQQVRPHVCEVCLKAFKRKEHLNIHRTIHTGAKTEVCVLCKKSFYRKDHLQKHLQTHGKHLAEQGMLLINESELLNIKAEIMDDDRSDDVAQSSDDVSRDGTEESMETVECDVGILNMSPVRNEERPDRPFACHLCEKNYKRKDHLKLHLQTHMAKDKVCTECGKAFHRTDQLHAHMSIHTSREYSPTYSQDDKTDLHAYLTTHHMDPDLSEDSLLRPIRMEPLLMEPVPIDDRRHECTICHRKFKRRQHLKVHYNVHTKMQPNIWCSVCSQGFTSNSQFESHSCSGALSAGDGDGDSAGDAAGAGAALRAEGDGGASEPAGAGQLDAKKENEYPLEIIPLESPPLQQAVYIADESALPVPRIVYVCKYCSKPFKRKDHYKIHLHIHTGVKSFFCPDCDKGFYRKDHLQKHLQVHSKPKPKPKKAVPDLFPINMLHKKKEVKPEITIHAPSNTRLRVPLQIKVPYQMVMSMGNGEHSAFTVDPQASSS